MVEEVAEHEGPRLLLLETAGELCDLVLAQVAESYAGLFSHYRAAPLITVNAARMDLVSREEDYQRLLSVLDEPDQVIHLPVE